MIKSMIVAFLVILPILFIPYTFSIISQNSTLAKDNSEKLIIQNNFNDDQIISLIENLTHVGVIKNSNVKSQTYLIPNNGKIDFVKLTGTINESRMSGLVSLVITKPDGLKEILRTPVLETGRYSTVFPINGQSQKGTYSVQTEFGNKKISVINFELVDNYASEKLPLWYVAVFHWLTEKKITFQEFISCTQHLVDNKILIIKGNESKIFKLDVSVNGQHQIRRGTTQTIISHVTYNDLFVEGARVSLTIEDYGENIIRESSGFTNENGDFIFSWEVPKKFNDIENLLAYIDVSYNDSSVTKLFHFQVYCLPGEFNCNVEGN